MELEILADAVILLVTVLFVAVAIYHLSILATYLDAYRIATQNLCNTGGISSIIANVCIRLLPNGSVLETVVRP